MPPIEPRRSEPGELAPWGQPVPPQPFAPPPGGWPPQPSPRPPDGAKLVQSRGIGRHAVTCLGCLAIITIAVVIPTLAILLLSGQLDDVLTEIEKALPTPRP